MTKKQASVCRAALFAVCTAAFGCESAATCEDLMGTTLSGATIDPAWPKRGLHVLPGASLCTSSPTRLMVIEPTDQSPQMRAAAVRGELNNAGWKVLKAGIEPEGDYVVHLERRAERLVFNVFPAKKLTGLRPDKPALVLNVSVGPTSPPASGSAMPTP